MKIITIANQKGGVGKTTTALSLSAGLYHKRKKVLLIDLDPQGNATYITRVNKNKGNAFDLLTGESTINGVIQSTPKYDIIPSHDSLEDLSLKEQSLKKALKSLKKQYDYVVIDTPPSVGELTFNAITASNFLIVTAQADIFSLQGIAKIHKAIEKVKKNHNPSIRLHGILLTRHHARAILSREIKKTMGNVAKQIDTFVYKTFIRECIALKESQSQQKDIFDYAPQSNGSIDYLNFINEVIKKGG